MENKADLHVKIKFRRSAHTQTHIGIHGMACSSEFIKIPHLKFSFPQWFPGIKAPQRFLMLLVRMVNTTALYIIYYLINLDWSKMAGFATTLWNL